MKIEDCKTVPEFFGVEAGDTIRIDDKSFIVLRDCLVQQGTQAEINAHTGTWFGIQGGRALVGCLTGQLKWSKHEPMTADEEKLLREIAAWFPNIKIIRLDRDGDIGFIKHGFVYYYFGFIADKSKAYEALAPILEKHGEINLEDYR